MTKDNAKKPPPPKTEKASTDPLWRKVVEGVTPLDKGDRLVADPPKIAKHNGGITRISRDDGPKAHSDMTMLMAQGTQRAAAGSPQGLDRRTRRQLGRGTRDVDEIIDLHGLSRDKAYKLLVSRIPAAHRAGKSVVLVVTGKGGPRFQQSGGSTPIAQRRRADFGLHEGVLRNALPEWLSSVALRPYVAAVDQASQGHGGAGAFYVRLKRAPSIGRG